MKATELRIGNWVKWNYEESSDGNAYPVEFGYELDDIKNNPNIVKPIPLTEEWLERLGFKIEFRWVNDCRAVKGDFHITLDHDGATVIGYPTSIGMRNKWMFVQDIEYVHQLQNLYYALTGEELNQNKDE